MSNKEAASTAQDMTEESATGSSESDKWDQPEAWDPVLNDLRRLKWLDDRVYELALDRRERFETHPVHLMTHNGSLTPPGLAQLRFSAVHDPSRAHACLAYFASPPPPPPPPLPPLFYANRHPGLGLERSEVIVALANMVYGTLNKQNPWAYSKTQIYEWLDNPRYVKHAAAAADLFCERFDPDAPIEEELAKEKAEGIRAVIKRDVEYDVVQVSTAYSVWLWSFGTFCLTSAIRPPPPPLRALLVAS